MRRLRRSRPAGLRNPLGVVATLVAIALIAVAVALLTPPGAAVSGRAQAVDGDTLRIGETRLRLTGLDAVELEQNCTGADGKQWRCGLAARAFVAAAVKGATADCQREGRDRYGRVLARCAIGGRDLGDLIVRAGWAVADLDYGLALAEARLEGRGIWTSRFDDPARWRQSHGADGVDFWGWLLGLFQR